MTLRRQVAAGTILLAGIAGMAGCEDAAKKSVVRAPVPHSTITAVKQGSTPAAPAATIATDNTPIRLELAPLPGFAHKRRSLVMLATTLPGTKEDLIARVEQKFASGEQNYKAGHLDAARKDFDEAVDPMLGGGYDLESDPKLSALVHRILHTAQFE